MTEHYRLAEKTTHTCGLLLGRSEVLRSWRRYLRAQSQKDITPSIAGGERRGKRKRETIFLERTRDDHRQSDEHWNRFKGNNGETSERDRVERICFFPSA